MESLKAKMPKRPPLTRFTQPVENVTLYSNVQRWLSNAGQNMPAIYGPDAWDILSRLHDEETTNNLLAAEVNQLDGLRVAAKPEKRTAYIFAAGASLSKYRGVIGKLKERGYLIASPTVAGWMIKQAGVTPDLTMVVDGNPESVPQIAESGVLDDPESFLLMTMEAPPQLPTLYGRHRTFWVRSAVPGPDGSLDWEPYSIFQNFLGWPLRFRLAQLGCVTNMMVTAAIALREHAGWDFDRIVLVGADYGYWQGFSRVAKDGSATMAKYDQECKSNFKHKNIVTDRRMVRYKASLMLAWLQTRAPIYTMSHGILTELPRVNEKQALEERFPVYPDWKELHKKITDWMQWFRDESGLVKDLEKSDLRERAYQVTFAEPDDTSTWAIVTAVDQEDATKRARSVTHASKEATAAVKDLGPTDNMSLTKELEERIK